ncbi:MAG: LPS-assembly protein LptD [Alphaproteobacteria bacterium]|nr:LPS-assembly protein LptD [Alphaproteobacteria bacterium]
MLSSNFIISAIKYFLTLIFLVGLTNLANAQVNDSSTETGEVLFEADVIEVNQQEGTIIAEKNVVFEQGQYRLTADKIIYSKLNSTANAHGNVVLTTNDGIVSKADEIQLDDNFARIIATPLLTELADGSRFTASSGERVEGIKAIYRDGKFSPCICDYEAGETPIWDLRSSLIYHDIQTKTIRHENVRVHVLGLPVVFLPWIAHPDPSVNRRTGVLAPVLSFSEDLGTITTTPVFLVVDNTSDIEFRPKITSNRGNVLETRYRKLWDNADLNAKFYAGNVSTFDSNRELVTATDIELSSNIQNDWKINLDLKRSSQDTFLRRYNFNSDTILKSQFNGSKTTNNSFYNVEFSETQNLTDTDSEKNSPILMPSITFENTRKGFSKFQIVKTKMHANHVRNDLGHDIARWNIEQTLVASNNTNLGIIDNEIGYLGSLYYINQRDDDYTMTGDISRANIHVSSSWKNHYSYQMNQNALIFEPKIKLTFIGGDDKNNDIPNRDAADFRIDAANMFLTHRFQGYDYVMPGARADIGLSAFTNSNLLGSLHGFVGVSKRYSGQVPHGLTTGPDSDLSDYVATFSTEKDSIYTFSWSGRLNSASSNLDESKTKLSANFKNTSFTLAHTQLTKNYFTSADNDLEEASISVAHKLDNGVRFSGTKNWDLSDGTVNSNKSSFLISWSDGLQDCLTISLGYENDPQSDRDIKSTETYQFLLNFKYLGGVPYDSN